MNPNEAPQNNSELKKPSNGSEHVFGNTSEQGFSTPVAQPRKWDNPPASRAVKERLKQQLMEVYYDVCNDLDKLERDKIPLPTDLKLTVEVYLTDDIRTDAPRRPFKVVQE